MRATNLLTVLSALLISLSSFVAASPVSAETSTESDLTVIPGQVIVDFVHDLDSAEGGGHDHGDGHGNMERGNSDDARQRRDAEAKANEMARKIREGHEASRRPSASSVSRDALGVDVAAGASVLVSGIMVVYNSSNPTPSYAKPAIESGIGAWGDQLSTNGAPVVVDVSWTSFGDPGILGFAGPTDFFSGAQLPTGYLYPAAMANALTGTDLNGSTPEITVAINSDLHGTGTWYYGSANPSFNQIDLTTVVTHEMGHGIGFVSSATDESGSVQLNTTPFVYDSLIRHQGTPIENVGNVGAALRSGDADIKISDSQNAPLYVPSTWYQGTSASHFHNSGVTQTSLMAPTLGAGTTSRIIDGYTLGVLDQMGWPVISDPIQPAITSASAGGTSVTASWHDRNIRTGLPADRFSVEAYKGSTKVSSTTAAGTSRSGVVAGLTTNTTYQIRVVPITNNRMGTAAVTTVNTGDGPVFEEPDEIPPFVRDLWLDHQIFRIYQAHFLRAPEKTGFEFWRDQRALGFSLLAITGEFQAGSEFINRYGTLTDSEFVQLVYNNVLGRNADSVGFNHWTAQLAAGMSRAEMMVDFAESAEYVRRTSTIGPHSSTEGSILRLYQAYFRRAPSTVDKNYWVNTANSGTSLVAIANFFSSSTEFVNTYGSLSDGAFVNLVYMNVLGRTADSGGYSHWTGQLAAGMSRGEVMVGFSESFEFIRTTGTIP